MYSSVLCKLLKIWLITFLSPFLHCKTLRTVMCKPYENSIIIIIIIIIIITIIINSAM